MPGRTPPRRKPRRSAPEAVLVVGIDPGLANVGLAAVREVGRSWQYLGSQAVTTHAATPLPQRLHTIYQQVEAFLAEHRPDAIAIEGQFFHRQREVAFKVGQAFGVCLLAAAEADVPVFEYGPMQVKQALVGTGRASKAQVTYMVRGLLSLPAAPANHHVADALALALTHLSARRVPLAAATLRDPS